MEEANLWVNPRPLLDRLARLAPEHEHGQEVGSRAALDGLWLALTDQEGNEHLGLPGPDEVTREDVHAALRLLPYDRWHLDRLEVQFIEASLDRGDTLASLADLYGMSRQALGKRYRSLGGRRELSAGRPSPRTKPAQEEQIMTETPDPAQMERVTAAAVQRVLDSAGLHDVKAEPVSPGRVGLLAETESVRAAVVGALEGKKLAEGWSVRTFPGGRVVIRDAGHDWFDENGRSFVASHPDLFDDASA